MSNMRTTRILAAGKSVRRPTPEDRLQRKMEARAAAAAAAAARSTPSPAAAKAGEATPPPLTALLTTSPKRSRLLPAAAAAVVVKRQTGSAASVTTVEAAAAWPSSTDDDEGAIKTKVMGGAASREEPDAATAASGTSSERGGGVSAAADEDEPRGGDAVGGGTRRKGGGAASGGGMSPGKSDRGGATIEGGMNEHGRGRSAPTNEDSSRGDHRQGCGRTHGLSRQETRANDTIDKSDAAMGGDAGARGHSKPHSADGDNKRFLRPSKPGEEALLRGVREGPLRDALAALLTSTVMGEDGGRVLAPSFPSISAMCELKYSEPIGPRQASAVERVILARSVILSLVVSINLANRLANDKTSVRCTVFHAGLAFSFGFPFVSFHCFSVLCMPRYGFPFRPGVLLRLSLAGKRIGDRGAMALAPALAAVRSVDLRSNNIGDVGTTAIASALREAAVTVRLGGAAAGANHTKNRSCILETLSLAGNRIEDAGAAALSDMLEAQDENDKESTINRHSWGRNATSAPELFPPLVWLSVAGNPGISGDARERLLQAGVHRQEMRRHSGSENQQPSMVVIA
ncbi:unnamed protein product [Ectocarpus sp. CCAP 1310/34]|nr:unnamed protein product [Ectocarpus sp. CCAP 1310/34]